MSTIGYKITNIEIHIFFLLSKLNKKCSIINYFYCLLRDINSRNNDLQFLIQVCIRKCELSTGVENLQAALKIGLIPHK